MYKCHLKIFATLAQWQSNGFAKWNVAPHFFADVAQLARQKFYDSKI